MKKHSLTVQIALFLAVVAVISAALSFIYSEALPSLTTEFPSIRRVHDERPYVINSVLSLAALVVSFVAFVQFSAVRKGIKSGQAFETLNTLISSAEFSADSGLIYLDAERRILSISKLPFRLSSATSQAEILGKSCDDVFPAKFSRMLAELEEKARTNKTPAAVEISDWSPYTAEHLGSVLIIVTPSFEDDVFAGYVIIFRSSKEIRLAESSATLHQQRYQVLFDSLHIGVAVFRTTAANDGGPDGYVLEANAAFMRLLDGIPLPYTEPASVVWPSFSAQDRLREGISMVLAGEPYFRCEIFTPILGKHFEVALAPLPAGRILAMVSDQTEVRIHEQQVLALNDQLQRNLVQQSEYTNGVLDDISHFNQAMTDVVEAHLEQVKWLAEGVPDQRQADFLEHVSALYRVQNQLNRYYGAHNLPYRESALVATGEVITRHIESFAKRFPHISYRVGKMPSVVANSDVLSAVIEQLMLSMSTLPADKIWVNAIEVSEHQDFLSTGICVSGWGFDWRQLFIEIPHSLQPLDWTITSDLDIAAVRRMVVEHGGGLFVGATEDGMGARVCFTVGAPT